MNTPKLDGLTDEERHLNARCRDLAQVVALEVPHAPMGVVVGVTITWPIGVGVAGVFVKAIPAGYWITQRYGDGQLAPDAHWRTLPMSEVVDYIRDLWVCLRKDAHE